MVNVQTLQGHWNELRGEIRKMWGQLTDDELEHFEGDLDGLVGLIQRRTGETRDKIEHQLDEVVAQGASAVSRVSSAARDAVASASESVADYASQAADSLRSSYVTTRRTVRRHPAESLAVVFGTGLLLGVVVGLVARYR